MKRYGVIILSVVSILCVVLGIYYKYDNKNKEVLVNSTKQLINSNALTMMYETEENSGEYQVADSNSWPGEGYMFNAELSKCENGSTLNWNEENKTVLMQANTSDKCYVYFDVVPSITSFAQYITDAVYTGVDGENSLYYHDGIGNYTNADQETGDNSYRYAGANPDNYVCFGSDAEICPDDSLYRIIGVFDGKVKLIKNISAGESRWGVSTITWSNSVLNTDILNGSYLNSFDYNWQNSISTAIWYVGGFSQFYNPPKEVYSYEIGENRIDTTYESKVGLVYVSDYGYAASPDYRLTEVFDYNVAVSNNWLYSGIEEWTISNARGAGYILSINNYGVVTDNAHNGAELDYRPTFYLNSDVKLDSGIGTADDPYRIVI